VGYEQSLKQFELETEHWKEMVKQQGKLTTDKIENVLLFPNGWMTDTREEAFKDDIRAQQLDQLRKQYIPHLVFIAHSVHHSSNNLVECMKIADIVADERNAIYKTFSRELMMDLLKKLRETSIAILNESTDPLGYHTV
jgi:nuclear pore complex protein Nup107